MKTLNYRNAVLIGYNRAASNIAPQIPAFVAIISLIVYHLQRLGVFLLSAQENIILGTTVNRAVAQIIKMFQVQYWTQITPLNYERITLILFSLTMIGILVKLRFFLLTRKRESPSTLFQKVFISWTLVFEKYFLYIPVLENSFYAFSQPGAKPYIHALVIFNLSCVMISQILQSVFLFWNPFTNLKCMSRGSAGEMIDIIGFLIMLATKNAGSNISVYVGLTLTALQFVCLFRAPKFVDGLQNQVEMVFQALCFALGIDILLQHHIYHTQDFPFLLIAAFIYWGLRSLFQYRSWNLLRRFENPQFSIAMMQSLPLIFEEYFRRSSLIDSIYPILAYRSNMRDEMSFNEMIFSTEDCSLEDDPHKQKTFKAFTNFIETAYQKYMQATDITKVEMQSVMVSYLFFVKEVLKNHQKTLILLNDFRMRLKKAQISMKLKEKIQIFLIEEKCLQESVTARENASLVDITKVFSILDKTEDLKLSIINFVEKKLEFLDLLKSPCLDLGLLKSQGITLTKNIRTLLARGTEGPELTNYPKFKELFKFYVKEVLQDSKLLGVDLKSALSYRTVNKGLRDITTTSADIIEAIQNSSTSSQTFVIVANNCNVNRGKIIRCTKELMTLLHYSTEEGSNLNFDEIVAAVNYEAPIAPTEAKNETTDSEDRKMCQIILKDRTGDLISAQGFIQHQIFNEVPCVVLFGEEERSNSAYFILCQRDGQIQGVSAKLASSLKVYSKLSGKYIHQILSKRDSKCSVLDDINTRKHGSLSLKTSADFYEEDLEIDFSVCPFGTKDTADSGSYENYVIYLYLENAGTLKDISKVASRKLVSPIKQLISIRSSENLDEDSIPSEQRRDSDTEKNLKSRFRLLKEEFQTRTRSRFQSIDTNRPTVFSSMISVQNDIVSMHSAKSSKEGLENVKHAVSEDFEEKENTHQKVWEKRNASSAYYGSMQGSAKRQRKIEKARHLIMSHKLPVSIEWMRMLQLLACLTIFGYLIVDYLDLTRRFEILSELSGITSFPMMLMTMMTAYLNVGQIALTAMQGLWSLEMRGVIVMFSPGSTSDFFFTFNTHYEKYVLQSNPGAYYSDFTYENYALNLTLPDTSYLNREVKFYEALQVLRGYMSNFLYDIYDGFKVNMDSLKFFSEQYFSFDTIFRILSDDLFSRLISEFDSLLLLLALRVIVGVVAAITIGSTILYIFFKLHRSSENLLCKLARIPDHELDDEIVSLREKVAYLKGQHSEEAIEKKPASSSKPITKKASRAAAPVSKRYKPLNQQRVLHIGLSIAYCTLFFLPFIVAYVLKRSPVNSCIPMISQYKLLAETGTSAAAISAHMLEAVSIAANGDSTGTLELLNATSSYIDEAKAYASSLYSLLNMIDSLQNDPYVSENLTKVLQNTRNLSFCGDFSDSVTAIFCMYYGNTPTAQFGIPGLLKSAVEGHMVYRQDLMNAPTRETAVKLTENPEFFDHNYFTSVTHVTLDNILAIYHTNFEEIAASAQQIFAYFLAVSIVYYCLLIYALLTPVLPWARREYTKVKEIYSLLPAEVLISNPYIIMALKSN